jgi:hypothetical protein
MTDRQKELVIKADYIQKKIQMLNTEINLLQLEYIDVSNKLFDSIEDKGKVKELLNDKR